MRNNLYKETFEQCQLSEECLGKVRNMRETSKRTKKYGIRYAAVVAVVLSILAGSNIISYAATGAGIAENVKIYLQSEGKKKEVTTSSDGTYEYKKRRHRVQSSSGGKSFERKRYADRRKY